MGIALGWVALLVAGVVGAPPAEKDTAQISYTVRMVEANGVGWRGAVLPHLKPVTRQGAATVWTLPKSASKTLIETLTANHSGPVVQGPRVNAASGFPVTIQVRANRKFITQVAWNPNDSATKGDLEDIRVGWHTTMVGRKLDQGILVKMVFEDTEIRAVHKVKVDAFRQVDAKHAGDKDCENCQAKGKIAQAYAHAFEGSPFDPTAGVKDDAKKSRMMHLMVRANIAHANGDSTLCEALTKEALEANPDELAACDSNNQVALEFPEVASEEILGEWLIPKGECLLVSFGPHTVADKDGKATVQERLAFVEAAEMTGVMADAAAPYIVTPSASSVISPSPMPAPYGPVTAPAPMPGLPVIIERAPFPSRAYPPALRKLPGMEMPTPPAPSRSFPEGIHSDGSKAKLPELPDDEMEDDESAESESAEPRPSPQSKKPAKPAAAPTPAPAPASDTAATKASFTQPKSSTVFLPSVFLPGASVGFQFLLPIKPLSLRLPFNQRLEIEIFGRVVPDSRPVLAEK